MLESHKRKLPTKKQAKNMIIETFKQELKKNHIKGLIEGGEIISKTILDYINNGKSIDEIKNFCISILHSGDTINNNIEKKENK